MIRVLWLRPSKGDNISVRRERIAEELRLRNYEIDIVDASGLDAFVAVWQAFTGEYDVIAGNVRVGLYLGYPLARLLRKPFLGDVSDPISDIDYLPRFIIRFFERYEWFILSRSDATVFVHESTLQEAIDRGIDDPQQIPNAVNISAFSDPDESTVEEAAMILSETGVDLDKPIAIYIGVFSPRYNLDAIIESAVKTPEWEFVFLGEGPLEESVQEAATNIENVYFPGAFPYQFMPGFLSHADAGFCLKDQEQTLKLREYGAASVPIIAHPGKLAKLYDHSELIFVNPDPTTISETLIRLRDDSEFQQQMATAAHELAKGWEWADVADEYDTLFREITS